MWSAQKGVCVKLMREGFLKVRAEYKHVNFFVT